MHEDELIPVQRPLTGPEESAAAAEVLASGWLTQGPRVAEFEEAVAEYVGVAHAVAVSSCTAALHLALLALGIGPGDEVIVPSLSFIATANAATYCGATPVFVEIDPATLNIDPRRIDPALTERTKAIMPVDQVGMPCDMDGILEVAAAEGIPVVEDAAPAMGSRYKGRPVGCRAEITCFSFHPRKVITCGEGGMVVTDRAELAERVRRLRSHAASVSDRARHEAGAAVYEEYAELGFNYRMTDMQAAIGLVQMDRLDGIVSARRRVGERYTAKLSACPAYEPPHVPEWAEFNYQSYILRITDACALSRDELIARLLDRGIATRRGIMTIHREPLYVQKFGEVSMPLTEAASDRGLILPLHPAMTEAQQDRVVDALLGLGTGR